MKKNYFINNNIFHISLLLFFIKWFFFFDTDFQIDLLTRLIFEISDWQYFTLIFNLSNLDFKPTYGLGLIDLKFIPYPIYSILYHSLFVNFFNIYGFIIIEFFIILLFFHILFNFFNKLGLDKIKAIFLTLLVFCLPNLIEYFQLDKIQYFGAIKELYNLRIPRPSITHLYLFLFFLLLTDNKKKNSFKYKQLALIGMIFAFMFGSYYYNLATSLLTFIIYYFYITHQSNQKILKYLKDSIVVIIFFILFSIPVFLILLNSEPDYLVRVGLVELDIPKKKILLNHFIERILTIKFIMVFISTTFFYFVLKNKKIYKLEMINLLYFIYLGSFLGPITFIIISPTISEPYHFMNMLVATNFFILLIFSFLILLLFIKNLTFSKNLFKTAIIFLLFFYGISNHLSTRQNYYNLKQANLSQLMTEIKKTNINKDSKILTFDGIVQTHLILNNYKNFAYIIGSNISINDEAMENKIIDIFKFLNLTEVDFNIFIKNNKYRWRFINKYIGDTFYMKYQANKLTTYKDSMNFSQEELKYISKSSPLNSQQLIIPAFELERLTIKFINASKKNNLNPDMIIIKKDDEITKNLILDKKAYCARVINENYIIYFNLINAHNC
jgi:hypothetical protein